MGDYNQQFEIQEPVTTFDEKGDPSSEWKTFYGGYASMRALASREYWEAARVGAEDTVKLFTRWHPKLDKVDCKKHRLLWHGEAFDIKQVENVGYRGEEAVVKAVRRR